MKEGESKITYILITTVMTLCPKCKGKPLIRYWEDEYGRGCWDYCKYCEGHLGGGHIFKRIHTECKRNKNGTFSPLKLKPKAKQ